MNCIADRSAAAGRAGIGRIRQALVALCVAACLFVATVAEAAKVGEGRRKLDQYLADFVTLQASFQQVLRNEKGTTIETAEGKVYLRRPGRFRWDYETPYVQSIVADGEKVWIYDKELEQVTVKPLQVAIGNSPALLLGGKIDIDKQFQVAELGHSKGLQWVGLKPTAKDTQYSDIRLGFEGKALRQMELYDNLGQTTQIEFRGEKRDPALDPALFVFTPPKGVDVINSKDL